MLIARFGHGSAEFRHCLYVVGGHTAATGCLPASPSVSLKQVEQFEPVANKWSMVAPLREGVSNAAVVSVKLKLFAFGGTSVTHDKLPKVQCYDPVGKPLDCPSILPTAMALHSSSCCFGQPDFRHGWRHRVFSLLGVQI
ncbi:Ectoderm-neural cortex protein 1 [Bagarius yarrelli]|uniref:Ectoderm-neural cortex protein 1 n=1 Tax=Bagarius yarrelli TaxID=175774 RepID=A0A556V4T2_BAGYA|nr:Ectoderm-neural cortex protein 1 [Bagarius yarrelli]